jgi:triosephosphate isomerase (TIM)
MNKLVAGNWKMNGSLAANRHLLDRVVPVQGVDIAICVPFPYLAQASQRTTGVMLGAQNVSEYGNGAFTGEVSAPMLCEFGCSYVIVGHSERRALFAESDTAVGRKAVAALKSGLVPIVCVGETLEERREGREMVVIGRQLAAVLDELGAQGMSDVVLAYEPVWAIGSGLSASAEQVALVHGGIRDWLSTQGVDAQRVKILYGGSVKPDNARALFAVANVDGGLIGGAALVAEDFMAICRAAAGAD